MAIKTIKTGKKKNSENKSKIEKMQNEFKKGEIKEMVLGAVGVSVLLAGTFLVTPNFPIIYASIVGLIKDFKKKEPTKKQVKRVLKELEKKEIISIEKNGEEVRVKTKGWLNPQILKYSLKGILEYKRKKKEWKGKWFLVIFDVPEKQRNKRDYLRKFLRFIGFYPYQQSVYIYPFECKEEVALIKKIVEGGKYITYVIAESIENDQAVKRYFKLESK